MKAFPAAAGAGGGTVLVALARNISDTAPIKSWLIILAPVVSVFLIWLYERAERWSKDTEGTRLFKRLLRKAKRTTKKSLREADSPEEKEVYKNTLRALREIKVAINMSQVFVLAEYFGVDSIDTSENELGESGSEN